MADVCCKVNAFYRRYSDDILIICQHHDETMIADALQRLISAHKLQIKATKTERVDFDLGNSTQFQYLGFNVSPDSTVIRPSSLARQWRKAKRCSARTRKIGANAVAAGKASKIYTRKLRRRFYPIGVRNFSSYARRSAKVFGSRKIIRQVLRLERMVDKAIRTIHG